VKDCVLRSSRLHRELHAASAPVNDIACAGHFSAAAGNDGDHFIDGASGCHDILADQHALSGTNGEPPAELHGSLLSLSEERPCAELPSHFLSDNDPTHGRGDHDIDTAVPKLRGDVTAKALAVLRVLQHLRALEVLVAVKPGGQLEMSLQQRTGLFEDRQNIVFLHNEPFDRYQ
jgi:hypothetical protein